MKLNIWKFKKEEAKAEEKISEIEANEDKFPEDKYEPANLTYAIGLVQTQRKSTIILFWLSLISLITSVILISVWFSKTSKLDAFSKVSFLILWLFIFFVSLFLVIHQSLKYNFIRRISSFLNESEKKKFYASTTSLFYKEYQFLNILQIHLFWFFIYCLTFYGLFILIVFLLRNAAIDIGQNNGSYQFKMNIAMLLENAFGNVEQFCFKNLIYLTVILTLTIIIKIVINYKINLIIATFRDNFYKIENIVNERKKVLNRRYLIGYCALSVITLIPLAFIFYKFIRKMLKK